MIVVIKQADAWAGVIGIPTLDSLDGERRAPLRTIMPMDAPTMAAFADAAKLWVVRHTWAARVEGSGTDPFGLRRRPSLA